MGGQRVPEGLLVGGCRAEGEFQVFGPGVVVVQGVVHVGAEASVQVLGGLHDPAHSFRRPDLGDGDVRGGGQRAAVGLDGRGGAGDVPGAVRGPVLSPTRAAPGTGRSRRGRIRRVPGRAAGSAGRPRRAGTTGRGRSRRRNGAGVRAGLGTVSGATEAKTPRAASAAACCSSAKVKSTGPCPLTAHGCAGRRQPDGASS